MEQKLSRAFARKKGSPFLLRALRASVVNLFFFSAAPRLRVNIFYLRRHHGLTR
jgi:hypothetical protein